MKIKTVTLLCVGFLCLGIVFITPTSAFAISSKDVNVITLQTFLVQKGFLVIPAGDTKGNFGPLTKSALIAYQKSVGLNAEGIFGPLTKAKIAEELSKSDSQATNNQPATNSNQSVSRDEFNATINNLTNSFNSQISSLPKPTYSSGGGGSSVDLSGIYKMIAQSQRIDSLSNTALNSPTISNANITGGSISNVSVGSLTFSGNQNISSLVASKIFPALDSTTALQFNKADGITNILNIDTTNGFVGIATTTPTYKFSVEGIGSFGDYARASYFVATSTSGASIFAGTVSIPLLAATTGLPCLTTTSLGVVGTMACDTASVSVDSYGAVGDGVTDDSNAFLSAIATGKNISLSNGKTYLISKQLNISTGQNIYGNGATIKRANQVTTTTTTTITSGVTNSITVANASIFAVGDMINVLNGTTYDQSNRTITSIVGNVLTLSTAFSLTGGTPQGSVSGTTNVYLSFYVISTTGTNSGVHDLTIDGNKSNYSFYRWETAVEIYIHGTNNIIEHNTLTNSPGEGIGAYTDYTTVRSNTVTGSYGNPIHLSGTNHTVVDGNRLINGNLNPIVGHADGCVTFSNAITHATISNNYMENCISGVGSLDSIDNSDVTIANNTIKSMTTTAIEGIVPNNTSVGDLVITGNRIYDSQSVSFTESTPGSNGYPNRIVFSNNYLSNTPIAIMRSQYITISNNTIDDSTSTTVIPLSIYSSQQISVTGNTIIGGDYGIYVANGTGTTTTDVLISGNTLTNQYHNAIDLNSASMNNVQATNNTISATTTSASNYDGIIVNTGSVVRGNTINIAVGHACINASSGSIIRGNRCTHGAATYSIFASGGTTGIVIENNDLDLAVSNSSGNTNFLSDNNIGTTAGLWLNNSSGGLYTNDLSLSFGASGRTKTMVANTSSSPYDAFVLTSNGNTAGWKGAIDLNVSYSAGTAVNGLRVVANTDGTSANVGIATTSPWRTLDVNGTVGFKGLTTSVTGNAVCITANNEITNAGASACVPSSIRFKENINLLASSTALDEITKMQVKTFTYKPEFQIDNQVHIGLIAEDLEVIDPRLVVYNKDDGKPWSIHFEEVTGLLVQAVQELNSTLFSKITAWLADAGNGIAKIFVGEINAGIGNIDNIKTKNLCVKNSSGETCITKDQLDSLLASAGKNSSGNGSETTQATSTPTDTTSPIITITGNNPATVTVDSVYSDIGASVTDTNADGTTNNNLGLHFSVDGISVTDILLDTSTTTTYTIVYSAVDSASNWGYATRTVEVITQ